MSILSGYGKFKRYLLTSKGYQLCSQWTSSNTVHLDNGKTLQTQMTEINTGMNSRPTSNTIKNISVVSALPSDAASHPDTLYIIAG